jgi:hypothetical protein
MPYADRTRELERRKRKWKELKEQPERYAAKLADERDRYRKSVSTEDGRERRRQGARDRYARDPERVKTFQRRSYLKRAYGITDSDYEARLRAQGGVCAICGRCDSRRYRLAVDHCHLTGRVRGLLCGKCNRALGYFEDSTELLLGAAIYLEAMSCAVG